MSYELSAHFKEEISEWRTRFPADRQRSAVIKALHIVQHENRGFITTEQMDAVAKYLELPAIQVSLPARSSGGCPPQESSFGSPGSAIVDVRHSSSPVSGS